jgi:hypothetical protein
VACSISCVEACQKETENKDEISRTLTSYKLEIPTVCNNDIFFITNSHPVVTKIISYNTIAPSARNTFLILISPEIKTFTYSIIGTTVRNLRVAVNCCP